MSPKVKIGIGLAAAAVCLPAAAFVAYNLYLRSLPLPEQPPHVAVSALEKSLDAEFRKAQPDLWGYKAITLSNHKKYVAGPEKRDEKTGCVIVAARLMLDNYKGIKMDVLENVPSVGPITMCLPDNQPTPGG